MSAGAVSKRGFLGRVPSGLLVFWGLCVLLHGVTVLLVMAAAAQGEVVSPGWQTGLTALACVLLMPLPLFTVPQLRAERAVWLGRVAPLPAWQRALHDHRRALLLSWALVALPLALLRVLTRPEAETWGATLLEAAWPAALLAALMGLALAAAAALARLLPAAWGALAGLALLVLVMPEAGGVPRAALPALGLGGWLQGYGLVLLMLLFATGALTLHTVHQRLQQAPSALPLAPAVLLPWRRRWQAFIERWRLVDGGKAGVGLTIILGQLPGNLSNPNPQMHVFQAWGSSITAMHGLRMATLTLLALLLLRGATPHWRLLLAPGGHFRRDLGLRIVGTTLLSMTALLLFVLTVLGLMFTLLPFLPGVPWARLPELTLRYAPPVVADLALAVALAAWLRAALGTQKRAALVIGGAALLWFCARWAWAQTPGPGAAFLAELGTRDGTYLFVQFALAALCTALARRAWRRADLAPLMRRPPTRPGDVET
ncbi:hypothetical protein [Rubrivivax rivuli]|uniref:Uncharacterized protein n=1 Tax=Rubrivivax rivuli TaxID=1862385 RepID=A0A437RKP2_9BURK|nr:hypothetical protein [Rubrivivax rivuli]RVU47205.1 hypothetical protein EOE66_05460 [Rubrivivax rivuli]